MIKKGRKIIKELNLYAAVAVFAIIAAAIFAQTGDKTTSGTKPVEAAAAAQSTTPAQNPANASAPAASQNSSALMLNVKGLGDFKDNMAILAKPGEKLQLTIKLSAEPEKAKFTLNEAMVENGKYEISSAEKLSVSFTAGSIVSADGGSIEFLAPDKPGTHKIEFELKKDNALANITSGANPPQTKTISSKTVLNIIVGYPFTSSSKGVLDGYPIGIYPNENSNKAPNVISSHKEKYAPPAFFFKITKENENFAVSENYKLIDFTLPLERGKDRFIALDYRLINQIEKIRFTAKTKTRKEIALKIIRGFISPNEINIMNKNGINLSEFTRYQYGDAAGLIADSNNDGIMDDLNEDGLADDNDAKILEECARDVERETRVFGGIGTYKTFEDSVLPTTPYLHIDTRGFSSKW